MPEAIPLVRGTLDVLVLKALAWRPMHSLEIINWLEDRSAGRLSLDDSAILQAFHRMEERALISASWALTANNRRARYYRLTARGRSFLKSEAAKMSEYADMLAGILQARSG